MAEDLVIKETPTMGKGMFANRDFKKDEFILYFDGEVIDGFSKFPKDMQNHMFTLGGDKCLYPVPPWMYLNHSCDPNAGMRNDRDLIAFKDIKKGEEIFLDYAMNNTTDWTMECHCGSKNCRKIIGNFNMLPEETKKRYFNYLNNRNKKAYLESHK
ncbi:MAG: SET domain-containing protein [Chloroflexota bacterium]